MAFCRIPAAMALKISLAQYRSTRVRDMFRVTRRCVAGDPSLSRSSGRQPTMHPKRSAAADPLKVVLTRMAELIGRGFDAGRLQREAEAVVAGLRGTMEGGALREVLDEVCEHLRAGIEATEEQASEIEGDKASARNLQRMLGAMVAARNTFGGAAAIL
jgi:hypothetical protein